MSADILDISPLVVWAIAVSQLLTVGLTIWNLVASGSRANAQTLKVHGEVMRSLDNRLSAVELTLRDMPTTRDFHQIDKQMTELAGRMAVLSERLRPIEAISDRLQDALLNHGGK